MVSDDVEYSCPNCDEAVSLEETHDCPEATPVEREDNCPMCGEDYDSWLAHLANCRVRERHEVEVAGVTDEESPSWEERPEVGQKGRPRDSVSR